VAENVAGEPEEIKSCIVTTEEKCSAIVTTCVESRGEDLVYETTCTEIEEVVDCDETCTDSDSESEARRLMI
jgi:hypothetical protein